jgi:Fe-S cluster assembly protein SufD
MSIVTAPNGKTIGPESAVRAIPVQSRAERFASNRVEDYPDVTGLEIEWKLTPVAELRGLIDGDLDGSTYEYSAVGESVEWIPRADKRIGTAGTAEEKSSANAWTAFEKALAITVTGESQEIVVTRSTLGETARAAHTIITAKAGSSGLVVVQSTGGAQLSENVEIIVEQDAHLTVVSVQEWDADAIHLASHFARVEKNGWLRHIVVSLGGKIVRVNPSTALAGEGAEVESFGVYFADAGQHLEQRVYVNHVAPKTRSRVNYKGALQGKGAHTVWIGDVLIGREAVGTDSYEQNRNLVLSEGARADSVPNLEIETGDILGAGHASATGRFDDEQLFYLQARGITEDEARRLVVLGFITEIIQKIGSQPLEAHLLAAIEAELGRTQLEGAN